jgi:predicted enzyme related to lactoylglutathione lyase
MAVTGPDFISLQVRDIERAAEFYEQQLGLSRIPGPPHAIVFGTTPAFAVRDALPGVDLTQPGRGIALWMHAPDAAAIHERLVAAGVTITTEPAVGPFGFTFTFADLDGYLVTLHDKA